MKTLIMLLAAAVLAGCQDSSPTEIVRRPVPPVGASYAALGAEAQSARMAIDDVVDRIIPALSDAGSARQVGAALRGLQQALQAGNAEEGPALAGVAFAAVDRYASLGNGDAAEVDAIRLALAVVIGVN